MREHHQQKHIIKDPKNDEKWNMYPLRHRVCRGHGCTALFSGAARDSRLSTPRDSCLRCSATCFIKFCRPRPCSHDPKQLLPPSSSLFSRCGSKDIGRWRSIHSYGRACGPNCHGQPNPSCGQSSLVACLDEGAAHTFGSCLRFICMFFLICPIVSLYVFFLLLRVFQRPMTLFMN